MAQTPRLAFLDQREPTVDLGRKARLRLAVRVLYVEVPESEISRSHRVALYRLDANGRDQRSSGSATAYGAKIDEAGGTKPRTAPQCGQ